MPNFVRISRTENVRNREQFDKLIENKNDYVYGTSRSTLAMAVYKAVSTYTSRNCYEWLSFTMNINIVDNTGYHHQDDAHGDEK